MEALPSTTATTGGGVKSTFFILKNHTRYKQPITISKPFPVQYMRSDAAHNVRPSLLCGGVVGRLPLIFENKHGFSKRFYHNNNYFPTGDEFPCRFFYAHFCDFE